MAQDFSGANTDDCRWTLSPSMSSADSAWLLAGWWLPTTLTAGRFLWMFGTNTGGMGAAIHTTTSELKLYGSNATTREVRLTSGLGLVTNVWQFLAFCGVQNASGNSISWALWKGTLYDPPSLVTVNASVSGSGSNGSGSSITLGNEGSSASVAFQGSIGRVQFIGIGEAPSQNHPLGITANTLNSTMTQFMLERYVHPWWCGHPPRFSLSVTTYGQAYHIWPGGNNNGAYVRQVGSSDHPSMQFAGTSNITNAGSVGGEPRIPMMMSNADPRNLKSRRR